MIKQTYLILFILLGIWLTACQDDIDNGNTPSVIDGNMIEVSIKTNVPALTVQTRAEATSDENKLEHIDILVFEVDEQNNEIFSYQTTNTNSLVNSDNIEVKARLKISQNNEKYRIVFIANLKETVENYFENIEDSQLETISKENLLKEIIFTQEKIWADTDTEFHPLPMWAESKVTIINKNISSDAFGNLNLLRSVARIGLSVSLDESTNEDGSDIFKIKSVKVYNARAKGFAVPTSNLTDGKVTSPSLVDNPGWIETENTDKAVYTLADNAGNKVTGLYVNEALNKKEDDKETDDALFLILKASYKGGADTYYRVGFYTDNDPVDILRNFTYNMTITGVSGPGEEEEDDAINSVSSNLTVAMTGWSGGEMKYVVFNGQYYLAVSESELTVPKSEGEYKLKVKTNYPDGWAATVSEGDWITGLTPGAGPKNGDDSEGALIKFNVDENNDGDKRTGKISFSCGVDHLSLEVYIHQTTQKEYTLNIEIDDQNNVGSYIEFDKTITFTSGYHDIYNNPEYQIKPRTLKVSWTPKNEKLIVDYNRYFDWGTQTDIKTSYQNEEGYVEISVIPSRLEQRDDWFPEAVGDIQFQVGEESNTRQNILIRRKHHEVYIEKADKYIVKAGETYSFNLFANTTWSIQDPFNGEQEWLGDLVDIADEDKRGESTLLDTMENSGRQISFTFKDKEEIERVIPGNISTDVSVRIKFQDLGQDLYKEYSFHIYKEETPGEGTRFGEEANCYVLQAGGSRGVSIPVSQANRYKEEKGTYVTNPIGDNDELFIKYIWTDNPNGFGAVLSAEMDPNKDKGPGARIIVEPGNEPGNAVIAVTNSAGKIYWSWHIWVVDPSEGFDPYDELASWHGFRYYEFLDRNLGALTSDPTQKESMGLYYQWGRKDPFPSAADFGSENFSPIVTGSGYSLQFVTGNNDKDNLLLSIENPLTFIAPTASAHWFGGHWQLQSPATTDFWNEMEKGNFSTSVKGIFDPCPEGWKTIPGGDVLNNEWKDLPQIVDRSNQYYSIIKGGGTDLGIWPHSGIINKITHRISNGEQGLYWTGNDNGYTTGWRTTFTPSNSHPSEAHNKGDGLSVRCIRRIGTEKQ